MTGVTAYMYNLCAYVWVYRAPLGEYMVGRAAYGRNHRNVQSFRLVQAPGANR